jgi:hypothetical protein
MDLCTTRTTNGVPDTFNFSGFCYEGININDIEQTNNTNIFENILLDDIELSNIKETIDYKEVDINTSHYIKLATKKSEAYFKNNHKQEEENELTKTKSKVELKKLSKTEKKLRRQKKNSISALRTVNKKKYYIQFLEKIIINLENENNYLMSQNN